MQQIKVQLAPIRYKEITPTVAHRISIRYLSFVISTVVFLFTDISRLEKSPLLANGYNPPPTHLSHMQFMQMNHHPGAAGLLNAGSIPTHGMPRPDSAALLKGQGGLPGMNAITR